MIPHTEYPKIAKERKAGKTLESIAKPYGCSRERIRQILRDHFPEITAEIAGRTRKKIITRRREKETQSCACGCGITVPAWSKDKWGWKPAPRYVSGHQGRNRVPYKRTPESLAKSSASRKKAWAMGKHKRKSSPETCLKISMAAKKSWATGKYDSRIPRIPRKSIITRRKLWKILHEHPEGMKIKTIIEATRIKDWTLYHWIKTQRYIKLNIHRLNHQRGHPYIISLAKESPVNLEDEMCSPHLNLEIGEKND